MSVKGRIAVTITALVLLWAGFAYNLSRPVNYQGFHRTMLQVAETVHDATQTGRLAAQQQLAGQVIAPFTRTVFDDATRALAGAEKKFAGQAPPDARSAALRDQLAPLLATAVTTLADTAQAGDDQALRTGADQLGELAERLGDFITAQE
ncbi:hypothetical protein [Actinoplanes sp. TFC3]|uniref:hypothetical protein n=1 Tax=Actinoplanes sp. TFC3 TaxID=1710355 RepID=UPI0008325215|nr:hypothetical protein [Actinoplanes sp. TFC3]